MEIKTKFKVGDLAKHKFEAVGKNAVHAAEIMEIRTQTCYLDTQIFYMCRQLFAKKEFENDYDKKGPFEWKVAYSISNANKEMIGWHKYREDELIHLPEGDQAIIKGLLVGNDD